MTRAYLVAAMLLMSNLVHAQQSDDERARMHFQSGLSYYEQARYEDAAKEFSEAYELSQRPALLLNLSQAYERDLKFAEAIAELERYLQVFPESPQQRTVETRIARLRELQARVAASNAPTPAPQPETTPEPTATTPAETPETTGPTPDASVRSEQGGGISVPGVIVLGGGGLLLAASLVTGIMAHSRHTDLEERCPGGLCPADADAQGDIDSGKTLAWLSTGFLAGGVVAAAVGTILILTHGGSDETAPASAQLVIAPGHVGGVARVSF